MVNDRNCETVQEEECSMVSLKEKFIFFRNNIDDKFHKIFVINGEFEGKINFLIDDKFYKIFSLNAW